MFMWCLGECRLYTDVNFSLKQEATHIFIMRYGNPSPMNIMLFFQEKIILKEMKPDFHMKIYLHVQQF